uniref:glucan endo-1,3-beta-D-glucosidase n=1 Tax=Globisporangium ultimum (strain ATCC 200006 / CBS 805.95 / DAOM BR144) TaxID=431595 RepID=K3WNK4_GLOUD
MRILRLALVATTALAAALCDHATVRAISGASSLLKVPLPFPIESHPFQLSQAHFAANEPVQSTTTMNQGNGNAEDSSTRKQRLADVPFPTGAFWTNFVLEQGESIVTTMPYAFRLLQGKVHVSYPFRVVMPKIIQNGFLSHLVLSSAGDGALTHQVVGFDTFSTTVRFSRNDRQDFSLFLVRGSPYVTLEYKNSIPTIETFGSLFVSRFKKLEDQIFVNGDNVDFAVFSIMLNTGQLWSVYASDPDLELKLVDGKITATNPFTGILRVALCLDATMQPFLLESAPFYPIGGEVKYTVDAGSNLANLEFHWSTRRFVSANASRNQGNAEASEKLLMVALPHHIDTLARATDSASNATANKVLDGLLYTCIKGMMKGVYGDVWHLQEELPEVEWDFADDGLFFEDDSKDANQQDFKNRHAMRDRVVADIITQLQKDVDAYPVLAVDSYNFGKQIGREARLLLIADRFKQDELKQKLLAKMETELAAWLESKNPDHLVYDQTYGGVVTTDGIRDQGADYGNGHYNDHHFHYGYFVYALAAVRKFDPDFIASHAVACALILGDIGAPILKETEFFNNLPVDLFFPVARHKDWFLGHSYASGLFSMEVGKSQESSSECTNAYYALALFSSLDENAQKADSYYQYARLMLATELRSTKKYWHMQKNSQIYESLFSQRTMVGVAGEMSVVYSTWFGDKAVYVHGINMIPFTPITTQLLNEEYVAYEYALLRQDFQDLPSNDIWRSVVVLDHAILDAASAWDELVTSVNAYDSWNSASNSMYWIATRQSWFNQKTRSTLTHPDLHDENKCFGFPSCSTAGENGTALSCCATLPGCCPSPLGCCPQQDPSLIPLNACFGEHQCAVLGLGCCNSIDGCCEPDPITGTVLGCCKNQHPVTKKPRPTAVQNQTSESGLCFNEPLCAAAGLDCCGAPGGCCSGDSPKLGCCSSMTKKPVAKTVEAVCQNQPKCAAANLECCKTAEGCCVPDPLTGGLLDCCEAPTAATALIAVKVQKDAANLI